MDYITLHDNFDGRDKIYSVGIKKEESSGCYLVFAIYGRNWDSSGLKTINKGQFSTLHEAKDYMQMLVKKKSKPSKQRKYHNIENDDYCGDRKRIKKMVQDALPEDIILGECVELDPSILKVATCTDNAGLLGFETGLEYIVLEEKELTLLVLDMEGNEIPVFKKNFSEVRIDEETS